MRFLISRGHSKKNSKLGIPNMKKYTLIYMYTPNFCHLSKNIFLREKYPFSGCIFDVNSKFHACWHPRKSLLIRVCMTNLHLESVYPSRESTNSIFTFEIKNRSWSNYTTVRTPYPSWINFWLWRHHFKFWLSHDSIIYRMLNFGNNFLLVYIDRVTLEWIGILRANATRFASGDKFSEVYFSQSLNSIVQYPYCNTLTGLWRSWLGLFNG